MDILRHYTGLPPSHRDAVVAIGNFDGVHLGHRGLIARATDLAARANAPSAVLAFEPHPQEFFHPHAERFRLTPFRTKARLLTDCGIDVMFAPPFDANMARKTADEFVREVLVSGLNVRGIVTGADFRFGKGRSGDTTLLRNLGDALGFQVHIFDAVIAHDAQKISSSEIRAALQAGHPKDAAKLLGRWWTIEGHVERGDGRGHELGYPTANMRMDSYLKPAFGIYAVRATVMENDRPLAAHCGVASLGKRPMFPADAPLLETYLFDFSGHLYGKHLGVELVAWLRPEMKFDSLDALKAQMATDSAAARVALDRAGVGC